MPGLVRFGVSLEEGLLSGFDRLLKEKGYSSRSEAIRDLIRADLVKKQWQQGEEVAGAITLVYNHHQRQLLARLTSIQHDYHDNILSTQHLHLDHNNCLEVIAVKGRAKKAAELFERLKSCRGIKHAGFTESTTGSKIL
ncbi:MAG: nickel-responsive transcriptional regulator NikR [Candidatus Omnitrophota bacterium]